MKHRLSRIRRGGTALLIGVGAVGGAVALGTGTAFAGPLAAGTSLSAATAPTLQPTGINQAAGNWNLDLAAGSPFTAGETITVTPTLGNSGGSITFDHVPTVTPADVTGSTLPSITPTLSAGNASLVLTFNNASTGPSTATEAISITSVAYDVTGATPTTAGTAVTLNIAATDSGGSTITTSGAANGTFVAAPTFTLTAGSTNPIGVGLASQAGGNLVLSLSNPAGSNGVTWSQNGTVVIEANDHNNLNCTATAAGKPETVSFVGSPTATVTTLSGAVSAAPTVSVSLGATNGTSLTPACATYGGVDNELIVTFTNTGTLVGPTTAGNAAATIVLSGISYTVGSGAASGSLAMTADYQGVTGSVVDGANPAVAVTNLSAGAPTGPSDASVTDVVVGANSPAVSVPAGSVDAAISPVTIAEATAGALPNGYICVALSSGTFDKNATPTPTVSAGNVVVSSSVTGAGSNTLAFSVTTPSTTASTISLGKLAVDAPTPFSGPVFLTVSDGQNSTCNSAGAFFLTTGTQAAYNVGGVTVISGATADGTAAQEMFSRFNYAAGACPGHAGSFINGIAANRPVVLATDANYPDALAASYLAGVLKAGILLTPTNSLSSATLSALQLEGITNVYVVGGPLAISNADIAQLKATPSYLCGGSQTRTSLLGTAENLSVTQIYGQTEYDTAEMIATYFGTGNVASLQFPGAYGQYNDTTGNSSSAPSVTTALPTAIVATSQSFQDAESAGTLAYWKHVPILITAPGSLSSQVTTGIQALGIKQVIVMGGPIAISNSVVTSLEGLGTTVLRVAGQDYTDTAVQFASFLVNSNSNSLGAEGLSMNPNGAVTVARGDFYSDGLAGAVVTGGLPTPLLLTENPSTVGKYLTGFLNQAGTAGIDGLGTVTTGTVIASLNVLGGPLAVNTSTISAMQTALGG